MRFSRNRTHAHDMPGLSRRAVLLSGAAGALAACARGPFTEHVPGGMWREGASLLEAVQEIYPALVGGRIHVAGGFVARNGVITGPTALHQVFDPGRGAWHAGLPLPAPRHHPHLIEFAGHLLAFAGFETMGPTAVWVMQAGGWAVDIANSAWEVSPEADAPLEAWRDLAPLPRPAGEAVTAVLGDRLHLAGGRRPAGLANAAWRDHVDTGEHFVLANLDGAWETAAPMPTERNSAAAARIGEDWHVVGGRTVEGGNTAVHEVYDPREDRWRTAAPMPQGQGGLAAASVGGRLYAFGGEFFQPEPGGVYAQVWCYVPANDVWQPIPDMPSPRHGLGAVTLGEDIHVIGGALSVGGRDTTALVEIFRPN